MFTRAAKQVSYTVDLYALALLRRHFLSSYLLMKIPILSKHNLRNQIGLFFFSYFPQNTARPFPFPVCVSHFQAITSFWDFMTLILFCEKVQILKLLPLTVQFYKFYKMPTGCNRWFLLQILLLAQHVSGTNMPIIRSSRVLYKCSSPQTRHITLSSTPYRQLEN